MGDPVDLPGAGRVRRVVDAVGRFHLAGHAAALVGFPDPGDMWAVRGIDEDVRRESRIVERDADRDARERMAGEPCDTYAFGGLVGDPRPSEAVDADGRFADRLAGHRVPVKRGLTQRFEIRGAVAVVADDRVSRAVGDVDRFELLGGDPEPMFSRPCSVGQLSGAEVHADWWRPATAALVGLGASPEGPRNVVGDNDSRILVAIARWVDKDLRRPVAAQVGRVGDVAATLGDEV